MNRLKGISPALMTPFKENGEIDFEFLIDHLDFLIKSGVDSLYILGTAAEVFLMDLDERKAVAEAVVKNVSDKIPVFMHVGDLKMENAYQMIDFAKNLNIAGLGAVTPYYYHFSQQQMIKYYQKLAQKAAPELNLYLYNLPSYTTNDLLPAAVAELSEIKNIIGIKNSMGDIERLYQLIDQSSEDFEIVMGNDLLAYPAFLYGAKAVVSGHSNVFPEIFVKLYQSLQQGDLETARKMQEATTVIGSVLKGGSNLAYYKKALEFRGFKATYSREPIGKIGSSEVKKLKTSIEEIEEKYL
ncbi:dihydrodipicolinate synthase family protein [Halanaerobium sp. ST460_2HS_T2]|uniref:dihydrodipicolinate synthase family protein n=1 Tax=Halanaerobium sp. ST460_2HS_T2 TaxID=2183914 RepID=UPI000DF220F0|nr:dihydrodipicolinate synthase family protein [Halanaerobium sp. ST460_2HS_T2]RCW56495.1 4-hydroxy-tetrahydrodipicolinate synthase [Halanaerobium sp. ST460_2HS_T2]